jgi:hypothetical protein
MSSPGCERDNCAGWSHEMPWIRLKKTHTHTYIYILKSLYHPLEIYFPNCSKQCSVSSHLRSISQWVSLGFWGAEWLVFRVKLVVARAAAFRSMLGCPSYLVVSGRLGPSWGVLCILQPVASWDQLGKGQSGTLSAGFIFAEVYHLCRQPPKRPGDEKLIAWILTELRQKRQRI